MMTVEQLHGASDEDTFGDDIMVLLLDVGLKQGIDGFNSVQRAVFLCQDFWIDIDMDGLSSYFYNRLPERYGQILETVQALRTVGAAKTADALKEAATIFAHYQDPKGPSTWGAVLTQYDPDDRLAELAEVIDAGRAEDITSYLWANREELLHGLG